MSAVHFAACNGYVAQVHVRRTYLGAPITYSEDEWGRVTPQEVRDRVRAAIEELIAKHQRLPGNVLMALLDRVYTCPRCSKDRYAGRDERS